MSANVEQMYSGEGLVPWWVGTEAGKAVVLDGMMTAMDARVPHGLMWDPVLLEQTQLTEQASAIMQPHAS